MAGWHEFIQRDAPVPEWPYPVNYGRENEVECDVLIIGGGVAGCHAAISAAIHGAKVAGVMPIGAGREVQASITGTVQ